MELAIIREFLEEVDDICNIESISLDFFREKKYRYLIKCDLVDFEKMIPIIIGIQENWSQELIDFYIEDNKDFPFIPHIDTKGKICLFDVEGVLIDRDLCGILLQSIYQAQKIIIDGLHGTNKMEFIDEFDSYWCQLPSIKKARLNVSSDGQNVQVVKYAVKCSKKRKKESHFKYLQRYKKSEIYVSSDPQDFKKYGIEDSIIRNAVYLKIIAEDLILPPDPRKKVNINYLEKILTYVKMEIFQKAIHKVGKDKLLIFNIQQPNGIGILLGFWLENCEFLFSDGICEINKYTQFAPVMIYRIDKTYLMTRTHAVNNVLLDKKILLVGCGSLGGYIANELTKAGIENIVLVDSDFLQEINIFRHLLGMEYVGKYKCEALQEYLEKNIPNLKITSLVEGIEEAIQEESIDLGHYDMIISAVGNHNVNRWLNQYMFLRGITVPVIYAWNEVLGIGNHIAYIKYGNHGCYECFIDRSEDTTEIYDRTSYCKPGQKIVKRVGGCGSTFIPYGSTVSLKTACMCLDIVKKIFENRYIDNMIVSSKGDDFYFKEAGLQVSNKYQKQKSDIVEYCGLQFQNRRCMICGEKNGC